MLNTSRGHFRIKDTVYYCLNSVRNPSVDGCKMVIESSYLHNSILHSVKISSHLNIEIASGLEI